MNRFLIIITAVVSILCLPFFSTSVVLSETKTEKSTTFSNSAKTPDGPNAQMPEKHRAVFKKYCLDCHDSQTREGKVDLETIPFDVANNIESAERWQKILEVINSGEMPPEDETQISDNEKAAFLDSLSNNMVVARKMLSDSGGVITLRRLNRREYQNTVEELLGVRPDVSFLPDDQANAGFDTAGASLFFSSDQLENYISVARRTFELAFLNAKRVEFQKIRIEPEEEATEFYTEMLAEYQDKIDRATAWKKSNGKPTTDFGFIDGHQVKKSLSNSKKWIVQLNDYLSRPETKDGATLILMIKKGMRRIKLPSLGWNQKGKYTIRVRTAAYPEADARLQYLEFSAREAGSGGATRLGWRKITGTIKEPQTIEFEIDHPQGKKIQYFVHQRTHQGRGDKNLWTQHQTENGIGTIPGAWIDWAELERPHPVEKISKINTEVFFEMPKGWNHDQYSKEVIKRFATRAFRSETPSEEYLDKLFGRYSANRKKGQNLKQALVEPLSLILSSPSFLYMVESTGNDGSPKLTPTELAVRLSYFLWSSAPDEELMESARSGKLTSPEELKIQTNRLLADERADRFVQGFIHQWLEMDRLEMFEFKATLYPNFDNATRESAREEIYATIHYMLNEKLPLKNLLKSDFVVINDVLADYYGIPGVEGKHFRKVKVPKGSPRGGLLGTAAVLAMGSDGIRSSPVERGVWVLRHLINDPPPPAPANVPQLSRLDDQVLSAHELQKAHQEAPQCAQCHRKIDPIGYGLEHFNAAGGWRETETVFVGRRRKNNTKEFQIEPSGKLPDGTKFEDYFELRNVIADRVDNFAEGLTGSLISYALGRPFGFTDQDLKDEIMSKAGKGDFEISLFIHALVQSNTFQTK